ncbi:hypothetical protein KCV01_g16593, partial [Aureobasidium melanogenum]
MRLDQRGQGAAQVGAEHEGQRPRRVDDAGRGQRRHQQHHGDAGMEQPGQQGRAQHRQHGLALQRLEHGPQRLGVLDRGERHDQQVQREQHEAEADGDAPQVLVARVVAAPMDRKPQQHEHGRDDRDVERHHLDDQRRTDIGAEHHGQPRREAEEAAGGERTGHQAGGGAALQDGREADAEGERRRAVREVASQPTAQRAAVATQHAAGDHVRAPQQQGHVAGDVEQCEGALHGPSPCCGANGDHAERAGRA